MTVLASESQGIVGNLDIFTFPLPMLFPFFCIAIAFLWGFLFHGDNSTILFSALCAIGRALRPVGRALRWVHLHLLVIYAWIAVLAAIFGALFSIYLSLNYPAGAHSQVDCWPLLALSISSLLLDKLHKRFCV